jgi:hypothetical protein
MAIFYLNCTPVLKALRKRRGAQVRREAERAMKVGRRVCIQLTPTTFKVVNSPRKETPTRIAFLVANSNIVDMLVNDIYEEEESELLD